MPMQQPKGDVLANQTQHHAHDIQHQTAPKKPIHHLAHSAQYDLQHNVQKHTQQHGQHDCCATQTSCDNCPAVCQQLRVATAPMRVVWQIISPEKVSVALTELTANPFAGYFSVLFKPPIFS